MKKCTKCKQEKAKDSFIKHPHTKDSLGVYCKPCRTEIRQEYIKKNPHKRHRRAKLGITLEQYNDLLTKQNGKCAICFSVDKNRALSVDHCHLTGQIRGLLCTSCNNALGLFKDNVETIIKAASYVAVKY